MTESFTNFMGGSPLNRLSWLRSSAPFLNAAVDSPSTRWILFNAGQPLVVTQSKAIAQLKTEHVRPLLGALPYFGQGQHEGELIPANPDVHVLEAARHRGVPIVFLGLHEPQEDSGHGSGALPTSDFTDAYKAVSNIKGTLYFSFEVSELPQADVDAVVASQEGLAFVEPRAAASAFDPFAAAVFAEARSMVDWNTRNKFCPACGSPIYSLWAGWKFCCSTQLPWADNTGKKPCPTAKGLHNSMHPRTDPVVIMIAVNEANDKILLGRNKKFPGKFYSALAGFMEPGETFEDAVKREMWEEAGVKVWDIKYHSGQPWPYPANLMIGFYAKADPSKPVRTDLDNELEDARWYTREEVIAVLNHRSGTRFTGRDYKKMNDITEGKNTGAEQQKTAKESAAAAQKEDEPAFRVPPLTAIAGVLIRDWAEGKIGGGSDGDVNIKGNL